MADLLRIAKERRATLLAEIARLDEFLRIAEALEQIGQGSGHLSDGRAAPAHVHGDRDGIPMALEEATCEAPAHAHARRHREAAADAPRLLLPHFPEDAGSADTDVDATVDGATRAARETRKIRSAFADYIEALRARIERHFGDGRRAPTLISSFAVPASRHSGLGNTGMLGRHAESAAAPTISHASAFLEALRARIERHFGKSRRTPALISSLALPPLGDLAFGNTAAAGPASTIPENMTASKASGIEPNCQQGGAAVRRARAVKPARERAGPMVDMAASVAELGERRTTTAPSFDLHLGQRIRQRRWMLGISQKQLGHRIGVELQQIKEYETGREQIDAARLRNIATALEVPVAFFFEGLEGQAPDTGEVRGEVLSDEEARLQLDDFSDDTFIFVTSRSA